MTCDLDLQPFDPKTHAQMIRLRSVVSVWWPCMLLDLLLSQISDRQTDRRTDGPTQNRTERFIHASRVLSHTIQYNTILLRLYATNMHAYREIINGSLV